ncbi:LppP/LprE family lipoprotein [Tsukamurella sp. 8F]|uniref:LppP/LprE family lipoprotein n=1 Tax=unclassified Tsukamurella TaxID=2633480 RepID=UPI0023B9D931|nr:MULTISPECIES: LppP/LprE family lipoprotein [unclassified Tsukamurella]MDF0531594.1 LppP/LprE family lipoprotein [Tsukamurella sp. 8J]MDF0587559.1 LppP/LprE family lipoprotein [Tsukamurella sp. 8F]
MRNAMRLTACAALVVLGAAGCGNGGSGPTVLSGPAASRGDAGAGARVGAGGAGGASGNAGSVGAGSDGGGEVAGTPVTAGSGKCLDPKSATVKKAVTSLGRFYDRGFMVYRSTPNRVGDCPDLMWAEAFLIDGTGGSPVWVLLFDSSGYLGRSAAEQTAFTRVSGATKSSVTVEYRWLNPGDATANPTGGPVPVTYRLSGGSLTQDRAVPSQAFGDNPGHTTTATTTTATPLTTAPSAPTTGSEVPEPTSPTEPRVLATPAP